MRTLRMLEPGTIESLFALCGPDGNFITAYVEAISPSDALAKYAALPIYLQEGSAHSAVKVLLNTYVPGKKGFLQWIFQGIVSTLKNADIFY